MPIDSASGNSSRLDFAVIADWVEPKSRVLDLGCGDGSLLRHLADARQITGYGIEIDDKHISRCVAKGVNVIQMDLDEGLTEFDDRSFDHVILSLTLQAMRFPDKVLQEMLRVGLSGIVTFPNFGHWRGRLDLTIRGRMPVTPALPHPWHSTPNIHLCTLKDFEMLCRTLSINILERRTLDASGRLAKPFLPNLFCEIALYRFAR